MPANEIKIPDSILPLSETLTPADQSAAREALAAAIESGTPVYPLGAATNLGHGANCDRQGNPLPTGLGLSTEKLNKVIDHAAGDLTITVEAGLTIAKSDIVVAGRIISDIKLREHKIDTTVQIAN